MQEIGRFLAERLFPHQTLVKWPLFDEENNFKLASGNSEVLMWCNDDINRKNCNVSLLVFNVLLFIVRTKTNNWHLWMYYKVYNINLCADRGRFFIDKLDASNIGLRGTFPFWALSRNKRASRSKMYSKCRRCILHCYD